MWGRFDSLRSLNEREENRSLNERGDVRVVRVSRSLSEDGGADRVETGFGVGRFDSLRSLNERRGRSLNERRGRSLDEGGRGQT
ncbi:hypothetical protein GCM10027408_02480 [Microbacterium tumbae]